MKKQLLLPLAAVAGGAVALALRLLQNRTGFESTTGLPIPGNGPGVALVILLVGLAVALVALSRLLPKEAGERPSFPEDFRTAGAGLVTLLVAGCFLVVVSGVLDIATGAALFSLAEEGGGVAVLSGGSSALSPRLRIAGGVLALGIGWSLFPAAVCCRCRPGARPRNASPALVLIPPVCAVARLVLAYRVDSVDPALSTYYVEILALVFLTLALYRLSSFAYHVAKTRRFALYAGLALALSMATIADADGLGGKLFYGGAALVLLGFMTLLVENLSAPAPEGAAEQPPEETPEQSEGQA